MRRRVGWAVAAALAALGGAACGGSARARAAGPCSAPARAEIARAAGTEPGSVAAASFLATTGAPSCRFSAGGLGVVAGIDTAPQAYARLERQSVEYSQNVLWSHAGSAAYPQTVAGLGLGAAWFPADRRLLATDGRRLVEVTVVWPGARRGSQLGLAEVLARGYLASALSGAR